MTARFSTESYERPQSGDCPAEPLPESSAPGLWPATGGELVATHVVADAAPAAPLTGDEVFVPENYEPNYAYPLIVRLTSAQVPRGRLRRQMQKISERNYIAVSVPVIDPEAIEQQLSDMFAALRRRFHLHTERVFLLGIGDAGTRALEIGLAQPAWFGGIAAFSAPWPETPRLLARFDELRGKHVLLGIDQCDSPAVIADALYAQQLLWSAGMHVAVRASSPESSRDSSRDSSGAPRSDRYASLLREVDRWIMQAIEQPELVC